ncbi:MAG: hypothetical protein KKA65_01830, partial [Nanoarchaeota archaeon]|nr:hypothetical protein [Nanoarchaeota archaeon]
NSNRGLTHLTDMFHKNAIYLQYLLTAVEEHLVDFNGIQGFIDTVIIGTTNQEGYESFKQQGINKGLKSRIRKVDIGYVLQASEEAKIYKKEFLEAGYKEVKEKDNDGHMFPHILDMLSLWAVMSRLQKPQNEKYANQGFTFEKQNIIKIINPLIKARLYDGILHDTLDLEQKKILSDKKLQKLLRNEFSIEGMTGISPRKIQNLITDIISKKELEEAKRGTGRHCLSIFRIFKSIENLIENNDDSEIHIYPEPDDSYYDIKNNLELIKKEYEQLIKKEIKQSIIGLKEETLEKLMLDYLKQVKAYVNKETILNKHTGKFELANEKKMEIMEKRLGLGIDKNEFRRAILQDIGLAISVDNNCGELNLKEINKDLFQLLEDGMFNEKKEKLKMNNEQFKNAIEKYGSKSFENLEIYQQKIIHKTLDNMVKNYNYCHNCAKDVLLNALKEEIIKLEGGN